MRSEDVQPQAHAAEPIMPQAQQHPKNAARSRAVPRTLAVGLVWIALCEVLLFYDAGLRGWAIVPAIDPGRLPPPQGAIAHLARWVAVHMTMLVWPAYLLVCDGLLTWLARRDTPPRTSPARTRPNRFILACLSSVPVWCFFDWINFRFMDAWAYHGLPANTVDRYFGYFIAFAAVTPAMLLTAQIFQTTRLSRLRGPRVRLNISMEASLVVTGVLGMVFPIWIRDPIGNLTLWVGLVFAVDPVNRWLGAPSILGDWRAGRWGRTLSLMAGGLVCGLLWEFWNYWAIAKWTYRLPFLGPLESYRLFEMPLLGFLGFLPFAIECWAVLNFIDAVTRRLSLRLCEPLTNKNDII